MLYKILIFLIEIGFGIKFNLVGSISLSELALLGGAFWYLKPKLFIRYPVVKKISMIYLVLLLSQVISEFFVGNTLSNALKGIAVTVVSYLHLMFLFSCFVRSNRLIVFALLGMLANRFIFGSEFEGDVDEVLEGKGATFLKFYLAPLIISGILLCSVYFKQKAIALVCIFIALAFVVLGARSSGLTLLLTGSISYLILISHKKIGKQQLISIFAVVGILGYSLYMVYVNKVMSGEITSGNSWQLKETENPYNPVNLLMMGRSEAFVGWVAFMDKPLFGHGAWANDPGWKYHFLQYQLTDAEYNSAKEANTVDIIPSHSVLIGYGVQNGLLAFLCVLYLFYIFLKDGLGMFIRTNPYLIIVVYSVFFIVWNGLFSPVSHFRQTLPLYFAFILANYISSERKRRLRLSKKKMFVRPEKKNLKRTIEL